MQGLLLGRVDSATLLLSGMIWGPVLKQELGEPWQHNTEACTQNTHTLPWQEAEKPSRNSCPKERITVSTAKELTALEFRGINVSIRTLFFISVSKYLMLHP